MSADERLPSSTAPWPRSSWIGTGPWCRPTIARAPYSASSRPIWAGPCRTSRCPTVPSSCDPSSKRSRRPVELKDVHWVRRDGTRRMDVELVPLTDRAGRLMGISVPFSDITAYEELQEEVEQANQELE